MAQTDFKVKCPYCFEAICMEFYPEEGEVQEMIIDCEVCCQPILYRVEFSAHNKPRLTVDRSG
ncbi:MAG: CPXCG motif-containing cysteine-rich protein [Bacteriovoracaceae bacterium]